MNLRRRIDTAESLENTRTSDRARPDGDIGNSEIANWSGYRHVTGKLESTGRIDFAEAATAATGPAANHAAATDYGRFA
jgi:hypothetical protein